MTKKSYLLLDDDELERRGITGCRMGLVMFLRSKPVDILLIFLILLYTLLVFVFFLFDEDYFEELPNLEKNLFYSELVILAIFVIEITLHFIGYHCLYFGDLWNIFDLVVIILSIIFVFLDLN